MESKVNRNKQMKNRDAERAKDWKSVSRSREMRYESYATLWNLLDKFIYAIMFQFFQLLNVQILVDTRNEYSLRISCRLA